MAAQSRPMGCVQVNYLRTRYYLSEDMRKLRMSKRLVNRARINKFELNAAKQHRGRDSTVKVQDAL